MSIATGWAEAFWERAAPAPGDAPVAFGGSLSPDDLLAAYRQGLLPMPCDNDEDAAVNELLYADGVRAGRIPVIPGRTPAYALAWWSPDPRPLLTMDSLRLGSGLTKTLRTRRRWTCTVNRAFVDVLSGCRRGREPRWLTDELVSLMTGLHYVGWYHSVEVWSGSTLVGGAIGLGQGTVFSCDTMFGAKSGASPIALADLVIRLRDGPDAVLDLQWDSAHVRRIGARFIERAAYVRMLGCTPTTISLPAERRSVDDILFRLRGRSATPVRSL